MMKKLLFICAVCFCALTSMAPVNANVCAEDRTGVLVPSTTLHNICHIIWTCPFSFSGRGIPGSYGVDTFLANKQAGPLFGSCAPTEVIRGLALAFWIAAILQSGTA